MTAAWSLKFFCLLVKSVSGALSQLIERELLVLDGDTAGECNVKTTDELVEVRANFPCQLRQSAPCAHNEQIIATGIEQIQPMLVNLLIVCAAQPRHPGLKKQP